MKSYFITGGTGSFGKAFIRDLINSKKFKKIIIFSRDEFKQSEMKKFPYVSSHLNKIRFFIGDVRDKERLNQAIKGNDIDIVIHAAALKQVPATEYNPFETIKTNIIGAQNVIEASLECNVKKVLALSTDKACSPINLYGATKLCSDKLFTAANLFKGKKKVIFSVVRYGNVLGSRGSVVPILMSQNKNSSVFTVTDKNMTRFNITLREAVKFVNKCLNLMSGGEIFVPKIPSYNILTLAKSINPSKKIKFIGIRPGEKIHEEMVSETDSLNTKEFKDHYVIYPSYKKKFYVKKTKKYSSENNSKFLSSLELKKIIKQNLSDFEFGDK